MPKVPEPATAKPTTCVPPRKARPSRRRKPPSQAGALASRSQQAISSRLVRHIQPVFPQGSHFLFLASVSLPLKWDQTITQVLASCRSSRLALQAQEVWGRQCVTVRFALSLDVFWPPLFQRLRSLVLCALWALEVFAQVQVAWRVTWQFRVPPEATTVPAMSEHRGSFPWTPRMTSARAVLGKGSWRRARDLIYSIIFANFHGVATLIPIVAIFRLPRWLH